MSLCCMNRTSVRLEYEMLFEHGLGLHGRDAGKDVEDLVVTRGVDCAEEEELVHSQALINNRAESACQIGRLETRIEE